jgi:hypothetical protein
VNIGDCFVEIMLLQLTPQVAEPEGLFHLLWVLPAIGALIWTGPALRVRRSGIFPAQLNDSELIRGSLINPDSKLSLSSATTGATPAFAV